MTTDKTETPSNSAMLIPRPKRLGNGCRFDDSNATLGCGGVGFGRGGASVQLGTMLKSAPLAGGSLLPANAQDNKPLDRSPSPLVRGTFGAASGRAKFIESSAFAYTAEAITAAAAVSADSNARVRATHPQKRRSPARGGAGLSSVPLGGTTMGREIPSYPIDGDRRRLYQAPARAAEIGQRGQMLRPSRRSMRLDAPRD